MDLRLARSSLLFDTSIPNLAYGISPWNNTLLNSWPLYDLDFWPKCWWRGGGTLSEFYSQVLSFPVGLQIWLWSENFVIFNFHFFEHLFIIFWVYWGNCVQSKAFLYYLFDHFHLEILKHHSYPIETPLKIHYSKRKKQRNKETNGRESTCSLCLLITIFS